MPDTIETIFSMSLVHFPLHIPSRFDLLSFGFGLGAPPRAQIRGLFVSTKGVSEIISILVEIARR